MAAANLAIKYRPMSFQEVVSQEDVKRILQAMVVKDTVPSSIMLLGPSGVSKTTLSRIFSRALLCDHPVKEKRPCNVCESCQRHIRDASVSYKEIDAASAGGVKDIRKLKEELYYKSGRYKVITIDEFQACQKSSQTVLLKVLEEAPPGIVLRLV